MLDPLQKSAWAPAPTPAWAEIYQFRKWVACWKTRPKSGWAGNVQSNVSMSPILDRDRATLERTGAGRVRARPVLLGTLSVRVDPTAERMAIDSALEARAKLILANMLALPPYPLTAMLAPEYMTLPHEEDRDAVRGTAERAAAIGIETELLRVSAAGR